MLKISIIILFLFVSCAKEETKQTEETKETQYKSIQFESFGNYLTYKTNKNDLPHLKRYFGGNILLDWRKPDGEINIYFQKEDESDKDVLIVSANDGFFFYPDIKLGDYKIKISKEHFKTAIIEKNISTEQDLSLNVNLEYFNPELFFYFDKIKLNSFKIITENSIVEAFDKIKLSDIQKFPAVVYFEHEKLKGAYYIEKIFEKTQNINLTFYKKENDFYLTFHKFDKLLKKYNINFENANGYLFNQPYSVIKNDVCFNNFNNNFHEIVLNGENSYKITVESKNLCEKYEKEVKLPYKLYLSEGEYLINIENNKEIYKNTLKIIQNLTITPEFTEKKHINFNISSENGEKINEIKIFKNNNFEIYTTNQFKRLYEKDETIFVSIENYPALKYEIKKYDANINIDLKKGNVYQGYIRNKEGEGLKGCVVYFDVSKQFQNLPFKNYLSTDSSGYFEFLYNKTQTTEIYCVCKNYKSKTESINNKIIILEKK